jgi:lipopolysaccharide transport system permease protein
MAANALTAKSNSQLSTRQLKIVRPPSSFSPIRLIAQLREVVRYGDLIRTLSQHRIKVRYKQSALGLAWAVMHPLSLMLIYTIIFSMVTKVPTNGAPYAIFVFVGLVPWTYFSTGLTSGTNSLISHINLITKVYFPREILPITYVIAAFFDFLIASLILAFMMLYYRVPLTLNLLWTVPIVLVMTILILAIVLIFSATQVRFRDVGMGISLLLQLWMFASPVVYPLSAASKLPPTLHFVYMLNPMVGVIENFRRAVLEGKSPDLGSFGISIAISFVLLPFAYAYFKQAESTVADII